MNIPLPTVAHMVLMLLMILVHIAGVIIVRSRSEGYVRRHRGTAVTGSALGMIALVVMFFYKQSNAYPHFASVHSKGGLTALILAVLTPVIGLMLVRKMMGLRKLHVTLAVLTVIISVIAAGYGIRKVF